MVVHKDEYTLEELATEIRMTARNVRAYQTKGLIPPPSRAGRRSVYGLEHLLRLQAIERARRRGASLSLIAAHLAAGLPLDDDTLVSWTATGPGLAQDITPLLAGLDRASAPAAQADVAELMAAGVFTGEGGRILAGQELAAGLAELHRNGFPLQLALRTARRALAVAIPLAFAVREATEGIETAAIRAQLGETAVCVIRYLLTRPPELLPTEGRPDAST
jgi:DNA-binding transcriptional MerR regulator